MVFIDEINARLENSAVYGTFLTPLEDGTYVRNGRTFNIRPCLWVFAGTRNPKRQGDASGTESSLEVPEKGSDFVSRLTLGTVYLSNDHRSREDRHEDIQDKQLRATENVYLAVSMLRQEFPDVRLVSELVLRAFWELPPATTVREIKHFVRKFTDIQYGEVTARNVPEVWLDPDTHPHAAAKWMKWRAEKTYSDTPDIEIKTKLEM
jgi:hypothetical protein